jgi:hypothetical protein
MKIVIKVIIVITYVLLVLNLFFWVAAHGSGHKIPLKTNLSFGISSLVLLALALSLNRYCKIKLR